MTIFSKDHLKNRKGSITSNQPHVSINLYILLIKGQGMHRSYLGIKVKLSYIDYRLFGIQLYGKH